MPWQQFDEPWTSWITRTLRIDRLRKAGDAPGRKTVVAVVVVFWICFGTCICAVVVASSSSSYSFACRCCCCCCCCCSGCSCGRGCGCDYGCGFGWARCEPVLLQGVARTTLFEPNPPRSFFYLDFGKFQNLLLTQKTAFLLCTMRAGPHFFISSKMKISHYPPKIIFVRWGRVFEGLTKMLARTNRANRFIHIPKDSKNDKCLARS